MGSIYVNKMQKYLELMNIKLKEVISQIHGASGIRMIKAIIEGERNAQKLLLLSDDRIIKNKEEAVLKALEGNYNDTYIFMLAQNMKMWETHQNQLLVIDRQIEELLKKLCLLASFCNVFNSLCFICSSYIRVPCSTYSVPFVKAL
jgi:hypothetical protein